MLTVIIEYIPELRLWEIKDAKRPLRTMDYEERLEDALKKARAMFGEDAVVWVSE